MNKMALLMLILIPQFAWSDTSPLAVVKERMKAYNEHNIDAFLKTYSDEIQIFSYPNKPLGEQGKGHLKKIFAPMFQAGNVSVEIHEQIVQGKYVVNHETVTYSGTAQKYVSIYEVEAGLIKSVQFIRE